MAATESSSSRFRAFNKLLHFESKPPPLPPKDPIYLQQRPVTQLRSSSDTSTSPASTGSSASPSNTSTFAPVSPATELAIRRANSPTTWLDSMPAIPSASSMNAAAHSSQLNMSVNLNQSTTTLALVQANGLASVDKGITSAVASSSTRPSTAGAIAKNPLGFLKFPKRSPRPVSPSDDTVDPPPPKPDEGISLPWNFQHNIHVDEGYVGIPPSWITSAGFTQDELADIQARRTHIRPLLPSERPNTSPTTTTSLPLTGSVQPQRYNSAPPQDLANSRPPISTVPIITNPTPRTKPVANGNTDHYGHNRNQPSVSTVAYSIDSHVVAGTGTNSSSNHTDPSGSTSPSSHDEERSTEDGIPPKLNEFGVADQTVKKTFWGRPRLKVVKESPSLSSLTPPNITANLSASSSTPNLSLLASTTNNTHSRSNPNLLDSNLASTSTTSLTLDSTPRTTTPLSTPPPHQTTHPINWNPKSKAKATASTLAAAGSSLVDTLKSSAVAAAGASKGVWRMRVGGNKDASGPPSAFDSDRTMGKLWRSKSRSRRSDETFFAGGVGSDEEGEGNSRPPVWQLYMQHPSRPSTAGSTSAASRPSTSGGGVDTSPSPPRQVVNSSASLISSGSSTMTALAHTNLARTDSFSLRRQRSHKRSRSGSGRSHKSQRSQRSQHSQNSSSNHPQPQLQQQQQQTQPQQQQQEQDQASVQTTPTPTPSKVQHKSPNRPLPRLGHQPNSGSVTSLESIPEASPAPGAVVMMAGMRGPAAASTGASGSAVVAATSGFSSSAIQSLDVDEVTPATGGASSDMPRPSFSSGSTIASIPVINNTTTTITTNKARYQPKHQHQVKNDSVSSTGTSVSVSASTPLTSLSAKSSDSSLNRNVTAGPHPTRPLPPPGSPLGLDELLFTNGPPPAPKRPPPPPPGSPLEPDDSVDTSFVASSSSSSSLAPTTTTTTMTSLPDLTTTTQPALPPLLNLNNDIGLAPPRLSLHQASDSFSSWSQAVLTGISFSDSSSWEEEINRELGLTTGGGGGVEGSKGREETTIKAQTLGRLGLNGYGGDLGPASAPPVSEIGGKSTFQAQQQQALLKHQHQQQQTHLHSQSLSSTMLVSAPASSGGVTTGTPSSLTPSSSNNNNKPSPSPTARRKNGQPLPLSKPPPKHPAPDPPIELLAASSTTTTTKPALAPNALRLMKPVPPVPLGLAVNLGTRPLNSAGVTPAGAGESTSTTEANPSNVNALPPQVEGLLSPTTTSAWRSPNSPGSGGGGIRVVSPPGSSVAPDSAQLWNEIEQMMDPCMISSIPGLHLSTALPPGAKDVLKSAGIGTGFPSDCPPPPPPPPPLQVVKMNGHTPTTTTGELKTVRDLVGDSPPLLPTKMGSGGGGGGGDGDGEDEDAESDDDSDLMDDDLDLYDGVVQSAVSRPVEPLSLRAVGRTLMHEGAGETIADPRLITLSRSREDEGAGQQQQQQQQHLGVEDRPAQSRDSLRSSTATITEAAFSSPPRIVRAVSIIRRADAYVIDNSRDRSPGSSGTLQSPERSNVKEARLALPPVSIDPVVASGASSSDDSGGPVSPDSASTGRPTPMSEASIASPLLYYLDGAHSPSPSPSPSSAVFHNKFPGPKEYPPRNVDEEEGYLDSQLVRTSPGIPPRPTIIINDNKVVEDGEKTGTNLTAATLSPFQRYRGWLSAVVAPLEEFIDEAVDPRDHYLDLREIAEGESGSVFAAQVNPENAEKLRLSPHVKAEDREDIVNGHLRLVAIKSIAIVPSGSPKLVDLQKELSLMKGLGHAHVLGMDAVYVDLVEDSLWVRMELMERSLADIISLVSNGLMLQDRMIARFASDILLALDYLLSQNIAHRDVRSDNLLLNKYGNLKLADFSNAVRVTDKNPMREDVVGVAFWQAPEVKRGPYNVLKIDVWSVGATVWEMAQTEPPFYGMGHIADRWPPLSKPELYSPAFHEFLRKCSEPVASRPSATELLKTSFINNSCGRAVIVQLLSQCMAIEEKLREVNDTP